MAGLHWGGSGVTLEAERPVGARYLPCKGRLSFHLQVGKVRPRDLTFLSGTCG